MAVTGDINVTIYGGNRKLWTGARVRLVVIDPFSDREKILVDHYTKPRTATVMLTGVPAERGQNYAILASATGHRDVGIYPIKVIPGGVRHSAVMLLRKDPVPDFSNFSFDELRQYSPAFAQALEGGDVNEDEFLALPPPRIAGALNIESKLRNTDLSGAKAIEFLKRIDGSEGIHQDRIFVSVDKVMPNQVQAEIAAQDSFMRLPDWANEVNHHGFPLSFKQKIPFGSLQLSFASTAGEDELVQADIDIDLFTDIGHFGEALRNKITRQKTDPFTVYGQLFDQRIFPLYTLKA